MIFAVVSPVSVEIVAVYFVVRLSTHHMEPIMPLDANQWQLRALFVDTLPTLTVVSDLTWPGQ